MYFLHERKKHLQCLVIVIIETMSCHQRKIHLKIDLSVRSQYRNILSVNYGNYNRIEEIYMKLNFQITTSQRSRSRMREDNFTVRNESCRYRYRIIENK